MPEPTLEAVQKALAAVVDPTFERSLGDLQTLSEVSVDGTVVQCAIALSSPSEPLRAKVKERIDAALGALGVTLTEVAWQVRVPTRETVGDDPIPDVRNVILVMSGKGGVGKSTVATNLALALRRLGTRVGLLDADLYGPSLPTMLGIQGQPYSTDGKKIQPLQRFGLKLMSIGFLLEDPKQAVIWRGPMLHGALQQFVRDVEWGELDYLVVDAPPGTGDIALTLAQRMRITGVVIVTTPQDVALDDVYKGVSMCQKLNLPVLGVVENMSYFIDTAGVKHELFGSGGGEKVAEFAKAPLLGQVPIEAQVREWGDKGTPVVQAAPSSSAGQELIKVAESLADHIAKEHFARSGGEKAPKTEGPKRLRILR
ncbi:MAG: Mrp/NBP35 family ATP-binding protein [Myxococcota bacterium]